MATKKSTKTNNKRNLKGGKKLVPTKALAIDSIMVFKPYNS